MANPLTALSGDLLTSLTGNVQKAKLIIRSNTQSAASGAAARAGGSLSTAQIASQAGAALAGGSQAAASAASPASRELTVQYNPSSISFRAFAEATPLTTLQQNVDAGVPSQNTRPPSILMSVDLIFDQVNVKDAFMLEKLKVTTQDVTQLIMNKGLNKNVYTVQPQTNAFVGMLMSEATRTVTFQWMDLNFTGEVSEVQARYTMFSTSGRPIRSIVRLSLQQKLETAQAAQKWSAAFDRCFTPDGNKLYAGGKSKTEGLSNILNFGF